jgi:hypothetical protein
MKRKPGWFKKAKLEWVRKRVRSFRIATGVGRFINDFEFERLSSSYTQRSADGREFEDLMRVSPERAFWIARRKYRQEEIRRSGFAPHERGYQRLRFYFDTWKAFNERTRI